VEFATSYFCDRLAIKIRLLPLIFNFYCSLVSIKYLGMLCVLILKFTQLEPIIFTHTIHITLLAQITAVLKP